MSSLSSDIEGYTGVDPSLDVPLPVSDKTRAAQTESTLKLSCLHCRRRKVRSTAGQRQSLMLQVKCVTSDVASGCCDQCTRQARVCVYVEHRRGRRVGTR